MQRILLTGSTGFLGSHLLKEAPTDVELYCGVRRIPELQASRVFQMDLKDADAVLQSLESYNPDIIIHTAAMSSEAQCIAKPHEAYQVNVGSVLAMKQWCNAYNKRLVFTSTDLIFDGGNSPYLEHHPANPQMAYGCLKAQAESIIRDDEQHLILRLPLLYGIGYGVKKGSLYQFIETLEDGGSVFLFNDEFRTPAYVKDVAQFIWKMAVSEVNGILHLGGSQRVSRLAFGQLFVEHLHLAKGEIISVSRADKRMNYRPQDTSLDSRAALRLGYRPMSIEEALVETYRALKAGLFLDSPL